MKKFQISRALIGLFVVLAVGIGLAACDTGEYKDLSSTPGVTVTRTLKLESGNKWSFTQTLPVVVSASGSYTKKEQTISFKVDAVTNGMYAQLPDVGGVFVGIVNGNTISTTIGLFTKSVTGEEIRLEFADDFDFAAFDAE
ncbi:hypothetical protein AGMMS49579_23160 [Spirochaetia bacterium]|nr:hypothetical protein AGMMS49579_23160 [Spirochaetia bacterium]